MLLRRAALAALALLFSLSAAPAARAAAWTEMHQTSGDVRMVVEPNGVAGVEHTFAVRVVMGPIKSIDLVGIDRDATLEIETSANAEDGRVVPAHLAQVEPSVPQAARLQQGRGQVIRLFIDDPKGLKRGTYTFHVRYKLDLVATRTLVRDGAMWHFAWTAPVAPEGYDTAKTVLDLPPAPTEPRSLKPSGEDGVLSALRRTPERDELELVRPHVSHGEAVTWEARIDPKALPQVASPELRPPAPTPPPPPSRWSEIAWGAALFAIASLFGALVAAKAARVARACAEARASVRPLIPLPPALRPFFAAAALACAVAVQLLASPVWGVLFVVIAASIATFLRPAPVARGRGPGDWTAVQAKDLPRPSPVGDCFDAGTTSGRVTLAIVALLVVAGAIASRWLATSGPMYVAIDALALLPIWLTGRHAQLRSTCLRGTHRALVDMLRSLQSAQSLTVTPWVRVPRGAREPDEVRVLALPQAPISGLIGIEIGFGTTPTPTGWIPLPQVLVRVHDASEACCKLSSLALATAAGPGRRTHERVVVVGTEDPTPESIRALVTSLGAQLADRRAAAPAASYAGPERRLPAPDRQEIQAAA